MAKPPRLLVCLACNDGDNGIFAGRVEGISVHGRNGDYVELDWCGYNAPRLKVFDTYFRAFGRNHAYSGHKNYVGNWCWDGFWMYHGCAAILLASALRTRKFTPSGAVGDEAVALCDVMDDAFAPLELIEPSILRLAEKRAVRVQRIEIKGDG